MGFNVGETWASPSYLLNIVFSLLGSIDVLGSWLDENRLETSC